MNKQRIFLFIILLIALFGAIWIFRRPSGLTTTSSSPGAAPEAIGGVGPEGTGGDADLNREKNRYELPQTVRDMTVGEIISIPSSVLTEAGREKRRNWTGAEADYARAEESLGVRVTGYLIHAKESEPESCNGYSDSLRDFHIWIADNPAHSKAEGMIVEMTPRWKSIHPEWQLRELDRLAERHATVRVTGWLMWDEEHPDEVGKSRGTQWEVHPVTMVEIFQNGTWQPLSNGPIF